MGGTIQAFTERLDFKQKHQWKAQAIARWATQQMEQTFRPKLTFNGKKAAFTGGLTWRKFGDLVGGDTTGRQTPSGCHELNFDFKGKFALTKKMSITLLHQQVAQREVPVYHKVVLENFLLNQMDPQKRNLSYIQIEHQLEHGIWSNWSATISLQTTKEGRDSRKNGSDLLRYELDQVRTLGTVIQCNNRLGRWSVRSGVDYYHDLVNSSREDLNLLTGTIVEKRGLYPNGSEMSSLAFFSIHSFTLPKWEFSAGGRWNAFSVKVTDVDVGNVSLSPSAVVWNGSAGYFLDKQSMLFASAQTSFRAPNIDDLGTLGIVDFRFETPNYSLQPEKSTHYQIGYKWNSSKLQVATYVYRNELRELINRVKQDTQTVQGYPLYVKENSGRAYIQGIEAEARCLVNRRLNMTASITYTYGQNLSSNEPVRRIPPVFGRLALQFKPDFGNITVEYLAATKQTRLAKGDMEDNRIPEGGTPGWNLINLHVEHEWEPYLIFQLSMLNLLNQDYRTHGSGINGFGRSIFATLTLKFG
ncbi:MAG TPA: TonB-dependent receptor [Saprospirales bacterium]|nr:TonB-dependent receptor [Saprospirales bacterium]